MNTEVVISICPNLQVAEQFAGVLVEGKVAACVKIVTSVRSVCRWHGTVRSVTEPMLIIKSMKENYSVTEQDIVDLHAYEVPEVIALSITIGARWHLEWLADGG